MVDGELLEVLLNEYEGEILKAEGSNEVVSVKFGYGALPVFRKLELLIVDKRTFEPRLFLFTGFSPIPELLMRGLELDDETFEEFRRQVTDGLYSFIKFKENGDVESIAVAVGNLAKRGVFYFPTQGAPAVPLIELKGNDLAVHYGNLESIRS